MNEQQLSRIRLLFTGLVSIIIWAILAWQFTHEGVPSHYLFQNPEFPEMSNWWGAILLPVLSWGLLGRIQKRIEDSSEESRALITKQTIICLTLSLIHGTILSLSFLYGYPEVSSIMFFGILFLAIFFRVYRDEFILGFILSMSFIFGAVLPTIFACVIAIASAIVYFSVQFIWLKVKSLLINKQESSNIAQ